MGARGPKPQPVELQLLRGNPGKRTLPDPSTLPQPSKLTDVPKPPSWLSKLAKAEYANLAELLINIGLLTSADLGGLELAAQAKANAVEAQKLLNKHGLLVLDEDGVFRKNPAFQMQRDSQNAYKAWCDQYGLTPVARDRIRVTDEPNNDEDDFFN